MSVSSGTKKDANTLRVNAEMLMKGVFDWIDTKDVEVEKYYKKLFNFLDDTLGTNANEVKSMVGFSESLEVYKSTIKKLSESFIEDEGAEGIKLVQLDIDDVVNSEKSAGYSDVAPFNISKFFRDIGQDKWNMLIGINPKSNKTLYKTLFTEVSPQQVDKTWLNIIMNKSIPTIKIFQDGETWTASQDDKVLFMTLQTKGIVQVVLEIDIGGAVVSFYDSKFSEYCYEGDRIEWDRQYCQCLNQTTTQCVCEVPVICNKAIETPCRGY